MISIQTEISVTPGLLKTERLAGRFSDFKPLLGGRIDVITRRFLRRVFETQGRATGQGGWKKLSKSWLLRRIPGRPILRQTDALYDALTKRGHPNQEVVLEEDLYSLTVAEGATDKKGRSIRDRFIGHQTGNNPPLPRRAIIPDEMPKTFIQECRKAVLAYVVRGET